MRDGSFSIAPKEQETRSYAAVIEQRPADAVFWSTPGTAVEIVHLVPALQLDATTVMPDKSAVEARFSPALLPDSVQSENIYLWSSKAGAAPADAELLADGQTVRLELLSALVPGAGYALCWPGLRGGNGAKAEGNPESDAPVLIASDGPEPRSTAIAPGALSTSRGRAGRPVTVRLSVENLPHHSVIGFGDLRVLSVDWTEKATVEATLIADRPGDHRAVFQIGEQIIDAGSVLRVDEPSSIEAVFGDDALPGPPSDAGGRIR